jgi:hypothetical protein
MRRGGAKMLHDLRVVCELVWSKGGFCGDPKRNRMREIETKSGMRCYNSSLSLFANFPHACPCDKVSEVLDMVFANFFSKEC